MARIYTEFIKPTPWLSSRSVLIVTVAVQSLPDGPIALSKWSIFACPMRKLGTTLSWRLSAEAARERQAVALTDLDFRHRGSLPTIIAGDFNAGPDATSIRYLSGLQSINGRSVKYHDAWAASGEGPGYTWTVDNPNARLEIDRIVRQPNHRRRLDYVFVGSWDAHPNSSCSIISASLAFNQPKEQIWASDHFGVVVDIEVRKDAEGCRQ